MANMCTGVGAPSGNAGGEGDSGPRPDDSGSGVAVDDPVADVRRSASNALLI